MCEVKRIQHFSKPTKPPFRGGFVYNFILEKSICKSESLKNHTFHNPLGRRASIALLHIDIPLRWQM